MFPDSIESYMRGTVQLFIGMLLSVSAYGQVSLNNTDHDFGTIDNFSERVVDIKITNRSDQKAYVLTIEQPREVTFLLSNKAILPDSTETLRLKVNPTKEGKFKYQVEVFLSTDNEPTKIQLKGRLIEELADLAPNCPSFSEIKDVNNPPDYAMNIKVVDCESEKPIRDTELRMIFMGETYERFKTNGSGIIEEEVPIGYYYFVFEADGYKPKEFASFINRKNLDFLVKLCPEEEPFNDTLLVEESSPSIDTTIPDTGEFSAYQYRPNNIVFLVDASSSMKYKGKLDLLKASMLELLQILRPIDRIALVSYASHAEVVLPSISGNQKEQVAEKIKSLSPKGRTAGGEGIKLAYKIARKNFIECGNNIVIVATDGAFNTGDMDYMRTVKKNRRKCINISVVGIKTTKSSIEKMKAITDNGNGRYVHIVDLNSAMIGLKNEIKAGSKIEKKQE